MAPIASDVLPLLSEYGWLGVLIWLGAEKVLPLAERMTGKKQALDVKERERQQAIDNEERQRRADLEERQVRAWEKIAESNATLTTAVVELRTSSQATQDAVIEIGHGVTQLLERTPQRSRSKQS